MEQFAWIFWTVFGVILIIAEIFTIGFVLFWFGIGAFAAALVGILGFGIVSQFITFAIVSSVLTVMSRTILSKYFTHDDADAVKTGIDSLPGQIGMVSSESRGALNEAAVKVYGSTWTAYPLNDSETLKEGDKVEVVRVQGSSLYVRKIDSVRQISQWREES